MRKNCYPNYGAFENPSITSSKTEIQSSFQRAEIRRHLGIRRTSWFLVVYVVFYVLYLIAGSLMFAAIELPVEFNYRKQIRSVREQFLLQNPCVSDEALENFIVEILKASNRGVSAARNATGEPNWSFGQSLFFSSTVITTIGYGHVTPLSKEGKIFCIIYAIFGIPLTLVLMSALIERLLIPSTWLLRRLSNRFGHLYPPFNIQLIHLLIIVTILLLVFFCAPAGVFAALEPDWDFLDSFYYCFISLTTIGLGDYIPGDSPDQQYRPLYKIGTAVYLIMGITFMMLTLTIFYDIPQLNLGIVFSAHPEGVPEKSRLANDGSDGNYGSADINEEHRSVVRVRSRRDDSPDDSTATGHPKDMLLP